jgi:hypothetical protein
MGFLNSRVDLLGPSLVLTVNLAQDIWFECYTPFLEGLPEYIDPNFSISLVLSQATAEGLVDWKGPCWPFARH